MTRPHCQKPASCAAKGKGHCRRCHCAAVARKLHADPAFAAKGIAALKAVKAGVRNVQIPAWAPADLHDDSLSAARIGGEERAASICRRLKRGREASR